MGLSPLHWPILKEVGASFFKRKWAFCGNVSAEGKEATIDWPWKEAPVGSQCGEMVRRRRKGQKGTDKRGTRGQNAEERCFTNWFYFLLANDFWRFFGFSVQGFVADSTSNFFCFYGKTILFRWLTTTQGRMNNVRPIENHGGWTWPVLDLECRLFRIYTPENQPINSERSSGAYLTNSSFNNFLRGETNSWRFLLRYVKPMFRTRLTIWVNSLLRPTTPTWKYVRISLLIK